jgi:hypothetical protein
MSVRGWFGSIIFHRVIDMDASRLETIFQLCAFLSGTLKMKFSVPDTATHALK